MNPVLMKCAEAIARVTIKSKRMPAEWYMKRCHEEACACIEAYLAQMIPELEAAAHTEVFHGSGAQMSIALHKAVAILTRLGESGEGSK